MNPEVLLKNLDDEAELDRLIRATRRAKGFHLYFAEAPPGPPRQRLIARLFAGLDGDLRMVEMLSEVEHLRRVVEQLVSATPVRVVCVTGLESWIPAGREGAETSFIRNLNASRDRFAESVPCSVVIWGARHIIRAIQEGAPDFFSAASGIYLFSDVAPALDGPLRKLGVQGTQVGEVAHLTTVYGAAEPGGGTSEKAVNLLEELETIDNALCGLGETLTSLAFRDRIALLNRKVVLLGKLGRDREWGQFAESAFANSERELGWEDPETLYAANNLALVRVSQDRFEEAEPLYTRALDIANRLLGRRSRFALMMLGNYASLLRRMGRSKLAEATLKEMRATAVETFGEGSHEALHTANHLGFLYQHSSHTDQAETTYAHALEEARRSLGQSHQETLMLQGNLARLYLQTGRLVEAEELIVPVFVAHEKTLGREHRYTLTDASVLAELLILMGRVSEGLDLLERFASESAKIPPDDPTRTLFETTLASARAAQSAGKLGA